MTQSRTVAGAPSFPSAGSGAAAFWQIWHTHTHLNSQMRESPSKIWAKNHPGYKKLVYTKLPIGITKKKVLRAVFQQGWDTFYCKITLSSVSHSYLPRYLGFGWSYTAFPAIYCNLWALYQPKAWPDSGEQRTYHWQSFARKYFDQVQPCLLLWPWAGRLEKNLPHRLVTLPAKAT